MRFKVEQKKQGQNAQPGYSKLLPRLNIPDLKNFKNYLAVKIKSRGLGKKIFVFLLIAIRWISDKIKSIVK